MRGAWRRPPPNSLRTSLARGRASTSSPGTKLVLDALEGMGPHDGGHHLLVDRQRHVDGRSLDHRRPVLVAEPVAELEAGLDAASPASRRRRPSSSIDQHVLEGDAGDDERVCVGSSQAGRRRRAGARAAVERDGELGAAFVLPRSRLFWASHWSSASVDRRRLSSRRAPCCQVVLGGVARAAPLPTRIIDGERPRGVVRCVASGPGL